MAIKGAKSTNILIPKEEHDEILRKQREGASAAIDRVNVLLRAKLEASEKKTKARIKKKLKNPDWVRGKNKTDFYDKF